MSKEVQIALWLKLKDGVTKATKKIGAAFKKNMNAMKQSALLFTAAFAGVAAGVWKAVSAFKEQERVEAEMNTRLISTAHAAGMTADELKKLASGLQKTTGVSDEVIMSAQNMLLTFTNIGKKSFPGATEAVLDMTAAMNKGKITQEGLKASAIMLGKGLNDPIGQLGALSRVGIAFTDQQKNMIKEMAKAGDMAGAQAIILAELKKEFGGTASNLDTLEGAQRASAAAFGDMLEVIGEAFLPIVRSVVIWIKDASNSFKEFLPKVKDLIVPITLFAGALTGLLAVGGAVALMGPIIAAAFAAITGPIGLAVIAISGLTSAFLYFKNSNSETAIQVRAVWKTLAEIIQKYAEAVSLSLKFKFGAARTAYKELVDLVKDSRNVFAENVNAEKDAIEASQKVKAKNRVVELEAEAEDAETQHEMDQKFLDRRAEMELIAEEARQEFAQQKKDFDAMSAEERLTLLTDTLGKEKIYRTAAQIDELIENGKHEAAKKLQDELYHEAFLKLNKKTIDALGTGWKKHWTFLLAGQKLNAEQRKQTDNVMAQAYEDVLLLMGKKSVAAFRVMQGIAIGQTIMKTYEAAQAAYASLAAIPIVGPILSDVAAGVAVAAGLARVDQIRRQEPPRAETGGYVAKGGLAEIHEGENIMTKKQTEGYAAGAQTINLIVNDETVQTWTVLNDEAGHRLERLGLR